MAKRPPNHNTTIQTDRQTDINYRTRITRTHIFRTMEETVPSEALENIAADVDGGVADSSSASDDDDGGGDGASDESEIKNVIREFLLVDNRFTTMKDEVRDLREERKRLIALIAAFMVKRSIVKIPVKPNDEECLQLTTVKKIKKPTKDEMTQLLVKIMSDGDGVMDKSASEIVETLVAPTSVQHVYDVKRKRKRAPRDATKKRKSGDARDPNEPKLRDLIAHQRSGGDDAASAPPPTAAQPDEDVSGGGGGGGGPPEAKRRRQ